jgi:hypothetical protein
MMVGPLPVPHAIVVRRFGAQFVLAYTAGPEQPRPKQKPGEHRRALTRIHQNSDRKIAE